MRLLRMLAVLLSNLLDRVRRALLSWAGVEVSAETHHGEAVDDRPAVWLEYVRARAPGLVAGKRHLPSHTAPTIEPSWPPPADTAPLDTVRRIPSPPAAVRATPRPRLTTPRAAKGTQDPQRSVPMKPAQPAQPSSDVPPQRSSRLIATPRATAARTSGQPAMVAHTPAPAPARQSPAAAPRTVARPPQRPLPDTASRAGAAPHAPHAEPNSAAPAWPALDVGAAPEAEAGKPPRVVERRTSARSAPRRGIQTDVFEDESLWAHLPDTGLGEWEVQSTRSLIREQLHLARLMKEQAGSSWSALHS